MAVQISNARASHFQNLDGPEAPRRPERAGLVTFHLHGGTHFLVNGSAGSSRPPQRTAEALRGGRGRVLVVDDEPRACSALEGLLRREGHEVATATNTFRGLELVAEFRPHVVLTDLRMPGLDGLELMERVQAAWPATLVVVMTAYGSVDAAVEAMKRGAVDFIEKPIDLPALRRTLQGAMERARLLAETCSSPIGCASAATSLGIVGNHPLMRCVLHRAEQAAPTRATVLLTGESGTGKGLIAQAIHQMSGRAERPFVELSCAALLESLLESELFGHERGAFTGAISRHEGKFEHAAGGTLYLDEIGSAPLSTQVKLLRFLQTRRFERVGGNETLEVDVRLIAATNKDLQAEAEKGRFREDLFYRLNVFRIHLPPLRERRSDIPALAVSFLDRLAAEHGRQIEGFSSEALERLVANPWPGNVRELEHAVEHAVIMAQGPLVTPHHLPAATVRPPADPFGVPIPGSKLAQIERAAILRTMMAVNGNVTEAAALLGISRSKIYDRLRDYGCRSPQRVGAALGGFMGSPRSTGGEAGRR